MSYLDYSFSFTFKFVIVSMREYFFYLFFRDFGLRIERGFFFPWNYLVFKRFLEMFSEEYSDSCVHVCYWWSALSSSDFWLRGIDASLALSLFMYRTILWFILLGNLSWFLEFCAIFSPGRTEKGLFVWWWTWILHILYCLGSQRTNKLSFVEHPGIVWCHVLS